MITDSTRPAPMAGQTWEHSRSGNRYVVMNMLLNTVTDQTDVLYVPESYTKDDPMFSRQLIGCDKAWLSTDDDGQPRFKLIS